MKYQQDDDLQQADFSGRPLREMTDSERAEMRRRFKDFVQRVLGKGKKKAAAPDKVKKRRIQRWIPPQSNQRSQ